MRRAWGAGAAGVAAAVLASLPAGAWAQGIELPAEAGEVTGAAGGGMQEGAQLFLLWLGSHWRSLAISLGLLWILACALTALAGQVFQARPIVAPAWGMVLAVPLWALGVAYYTVFRPGAFQTGSANWVFWTLLGVIGAGFLAVPLVSLVRRNGM
jgi:hypothetical protein